jgi:GT2 family glycosyltransferase
MQKLTLGVLVTAYNSWDIALRCVEAHLTHAGRTIERILLIDDHSDESYDRRLDPKVKIIRNAQNLGFVKSVNLGFKNLDTDIVMLFDADAYPLMDYSRIVIDEFSKNDRLSIIGFTTYDGNNQLTGSSEEEPDALRLVLGQRVDNLYRKVFIRHHPKTVVYSCAMAVRRKAFDEIGGFDENFDWLEPDSDLCLRMRENGWIIKQSSELKAYHDGGGTPQQASDRVLRFYKNRWYLLRKYGRVKNVSVVKNLILFRLRMEYLALLLFGKLIFANKETLRDKVSGRQRVISYCKENFK